MWPRIDGLRTMELGSPGEMRARLNGLVLQGFKRATCGLLDDYVSEEEEIEVPGEILVLVDDFGADVGHVVVTEVRQCPFGDVTWQMAAREGEGDQNLREWREGHQRYWLQADERVVTDETPVVWLAFEVV